MAKPKEIKKIDDALLAQALNDWQEINAKIKEFQDKKTKLEAYVMETYCDIDISSDATGTERIATPDSTVAFKIEHKISTSVDKQRADEMLERMGVKPEHFFNVKYDYSISVAKGLTDQEKIALAPCLVKKRAKSSFTVEVI